MSAANPEAALEIESGVLSGTAGEMLAAVPTAIAGLYLLALAGVARLAPARARAFLDAHASSAATHFLELALRVTVGASLVFTAPRMRFPDVFGGFGWVLIGTSFALGLVPWKLHQRFARWSVPLATQRMPLLALGAVLGGVFLLFSLFPLSDAG